jgi:hypothetical protein
MYNQPAEHFRMSDEPTHAGVNLLTCSLRDDSGNGLVSPRIYAHRSRVIRQQTILLRLRTGDSPDAVEEGKRRPNVMSRPKDHREEGGEG